MALLTQNKTKIGTSEINDEVIDELVENSGLANIANAQISASSSLNKAGGDIGVLCNELVGLIQGADSDSVRLLSIKAALEIHGAMRNKKQDSATPQIALVVTGETAKVQAIFNPVRT